MPTTGDTAAMVAARTRFLAAEHFRPLAHAATSLLSRSLTSSTPGVIVDVGAGTGWLLARVLEALPDRSGLALDASKHAARRAASAHPRAVAIVSDAWSSLPLQDGAAAAILSFFAPRNPAEFERVLEIGGLLLVITPQPDHLTELAGPLELISVDPRKSARLDAAFENGWKMRATESVRSTMSLDPRDVADVVAMGPSAHHATPDAVQRVLSALDGHSLSVTAAFDLRLLERTSVKNL